MSDVRKSLVGYTDERGNIHLTEWEATWANERYADELAEQSKSIAESSAQTAEATLLSLKYQILRNQKQDRERSEIEAAKARAEQEQAIREQEHRERIEASQAAQADYQRIQSEIAYLSHASNYERIVFAISKSALDLSREVALDFQSLSDSVNRLIEEYTSALDTFSAINRDLFSAFSRVKSEVAQRLDPIEREYAQESAQIDVSLGELYRLIDRAENAVSVLESKSTDTFPARPPKKTPWLLSLLPTRKTVKPPVASEPNPAELLLLKCAKLAELRAQKNTLQLADQTLLRKKVADTDKIISVVTVELTSGRFTSYSALEQEVRKAKAEAAQKVDELKMRLNLTVRSFIEESVASNLELFVQTPERIASILEWSEKGKFPQSILPNPRIAQGEASAIKLLLLPAMEKAVSAAVLRHASQYEKSLDRISQMAETVG